MAHALFLLGKVHVDYRNYIFVIMSLSFTRNHMAMQRTQRNWLNMYAGSKSFKNISSREGHKQHLLIKKVLALHLKTFSDVNYKVKSDIMQTLN